MRYKTAVNLAIAILPCALIPAHTADLALTRSSINRASVAHLNSPLTTRSDMPAKSGLCDPSSGAGAVSDGAQAAPSNTAPSNTLPAATSEGAASNQRKLVAQAPGVNPGAWPSPASSQVEPISLRDLGLVRRDLEDLARRHGQPLPPPGMTREQLGGFFWKLVTALAKLPREQMGPVDYMKIGRLTNDFEELVQEVKGKLTMVVAKNDLPPQRCITNFS